MAVVGTTNSLPLIHLLQVKTSEPGSVRVLVEGARGAGALVLRAGNVVHATYAGRQGEAAAKAILFEKSISYIVTSNVNVQGGTVSIPLKQLLLEGAPDWLDAERVDPAEADVSRASDGQRHVVRVPLESGTALRRPTMTPAEAPPAPVADDAVPEAARRRAPLVAVGVVAVLATLLVGWLTFSGGGGDATATPAETGAERRLEERTAAVSSTEDTTLEATELSGAGDRLPELVSGEPPRSAGALRPTVVCRLLVDERGRVGEASVYRERAGLEALEAQALEAVRDFRFSPAERDGRRVAVWINWPVEFR